MWRLKRLTGGRIRPGMTVREFFVKEISMIPTKDSLLAGWSSNCDDKLQLSATTYGCTTAQATQYHALHLLWMAAYDAVVAARANGSQTKQLTQAKTTAKQNLLDFAREIYAFVQASLTVSAENKTALGVV